MMARTEHDREETRQFRDLRKQLQTERRENAALRKKIIQLENSLEMVGVEEDSDIELVEDPRDASYKKKNRVDTCPKCGSYSLEIFSLMGKSYFRCSCGSKGWYNPE